MDCNPIRHPLPTGFPRQDYWVVAIFSRDSSNPQETKTHIFCTLSGIFFTAENLPLPYFLLRQTWAKPLILALRWHFPELASLRIGQKMSSWGIFSWLHLKRLDGRRPWEWLTSKLKCREGTWKLSIGSDDHLYEPVWVLFCAHIYTCRAGD